jgi:predicted esterase
MKATEHHIRVVKRARYYTLGDAAGAADVWIVCHGYGQLAGQFIQDLESIAAAGRYIIAPEALHRFYKDPVTVPAAQRRIGATWMTREDREHDIADYVDYLDLLVRDIMSRAPTAYLRVLGFSQGSSTVLRWAAGATRVPDQLILWAGEVPNDVDWSVAAKKLAATRIDAVHGDRDEMMPRSSLDRNLAVLAGAGLAYRLHEFSGRHHLNAGMLRKLVDERR